MATPILTGPDGAPFRAWTALTETAVFRVNIINKHEGDLQEEVVHHMTIPPGTKERMADLVAHGSTGSEKGFLKLKSMTTPLYT